jgi:hypothetical protein
MEHIEFSHIPLTDLREYPGNAKEHDLDELRLSLRKGQFQPIVVREHEGERIILSGHGTAEAAKLEGWATVECKVINCTDEEALWINLAANRTGELAGYDQPLLAALIEQLNGDYAGTGWEADDLDDLLAALDKVAETPYAATQADYAETPEETEARSELGTGVSLAARGIRETVIILTQDNHDELHGHMASLRSVLEGEDFTNGEILLRGARALRLLTAARAAHGAGHDCQSCNDLQATTKAV